MKKIILLIVSVFVLQGVFAQQKMITGKVVDAQTGESLPGANIVIKGTTTGTITDMEGFFNMEYPKNDTGLLVITFMGYERFETLFKDRAFINVQLRPEAKGLDEIVVIGYGTIKKSDLTGSVASIKGADLTKASSSNPMEALKGKIAGLQVSSSSGEPGRAPVVRVRGVGTLNNANPIYVVDGVILDDISFLNSNDIASIELLKDASATAIYGSRGANGVFIITSKHGGTGIDPQINFKVEYGIQKLNKKLDLLDGYEFARALNDIASGTINNIDAVNNYDWQDAIFKENTFLRSYNLSFMGGADKLSYYFGTGIYDNEGIIPKSNYKRYNFKINTLYQAKDYLKIGTDIAVARINDDLSPGVVETAYRAWPIDEPYDANGNFAEVRGSGNPLAAIEYTNNNTIENRIVSNLFTELTFFKDFIFKTSYQFDYRTSKNRNFTPEYYVSPTQQSSRNALSIDFTESQTWIWENTLNHYKEIGDHSFSSVAGYTMQESFFESPTVTVYRLVREDPEYWFFNATLTDTVNVSHNLDDVFQTSMLSFLFRTNYSYKSKYLLTVSYRTDGSSKFNDENKFGHFPSLALGWNITKESFFDVKAINRLKVRGSWGIIGNEKISWFDRFSLIGNQYGAVFGNPEAYYAGATFLGTGNDDLIWESTKQTNFGVEIGLLKDKITGEFDYYIKETDDILVLLDVPGYYGFGSYQRVRFNAANVLNRGLEYYLKWSDNIGAFNYSVTTTGTKVHNEVQSMGAVTPSDSVIYAGNLSNGKRVTVTSVGEPIGSFFGYQIDGIFQNEEQLNSLPHLSGQSVGDFIYRDNNGDGVINADDRAVIGSPIPDFIYGFGLNFDYKSFDLSFDFEGMLGNQIYNAKNQTRFGIYNFETTVIDRWDGENTSDYEPELDILAGNYEQSEYYVEDGSYFRLRTLTLGFSLPERWLTPIDVSSVNIYLRATNLFILTKYSGYSPDIGGSPLSSGIDNGIYPSTNVNSFGINIIF